MPTLPELIPDLNVLLALAPEQLGRALMAAGASGMQNGMISPGGVTGDQVLYGLGIPGPTVYPRGREGEVEIAIGEGWHWLELNMLIMPAPGPNGDNGWKVFTRRSKALLNDEPAFQSFTSAAGFPRSLLHAAQGDDVWLELAQGHLSDAVFKSFRAVEEAVRAAGGFQAQDVGVDLMRKAFNPANGPLSRQADPPAEREALSALFAGAIGSYKNPHSHRTIIIGEAREAQEMLVLAAHLLRIVDTRRAP